MKKINSSASLMILRAKNLGNTYPYGGLIPSLLMVLSSIRIKQAVYDELWEGDT